MFDQVVVRPRRRRFKTVAIIASAVAHAAAVTGLIVGTMWHVDKVALGPVKEDIVMAQPKPRAGTEAAAPAKRLDVPKRTEKRLTKDVVQPHLPPPEIPPVTGGGGDTTSTATGTGTGECRALGTVDDGRPLCCREASEADDGRPLCQPVACPPGERCDGEPVVEPIDAGVPPIDAPEPCNLPPHISQGKRVAGDDQIRPTRETQLEMVRSGKDLVRATFQLCINQDGAVSSVRRMGPGTGFGAYDQALEQAIRGWRYEPSILMGCNRAATSVCTVATFVYRMKD